MGVDVFLEGAYMKRRTFICGMTFGLLALKEPRITNPLRSEGAQD